MKVQGLLRRFIDEVKLTPEIVNQTSEYLFQRRLLMIPAGNQELYETLVYLKDLMDVNGLYSVDDVLHYYEHRRSSLRLFMKQANEENEYEAMEEVADSHLLPALPDGWVIHLMDRSELNSRPPCTVSLHICIAHNISRVFHSISRSVSAPISRIYRLKRRNRRNTIS